MSVVHTAVMHKILPAYVTYPIYKIAMNKIKGIITIKNQHKIMNNRKITNNYSIGCIQIQYIMYYIFRFIFLLFIVL